MFFDLMTRLSQLALPVFIFLTMANIGLTQHPRKILEHWRNWPFLLKMLAANFIAAPGIMYLLLQIWPLEPQFMAGLFVYSMCAGAPFLIKLTATSEHDMALGAATMLLLVLGTIVIAPVALPAILSRLEVDGGAMAWTLVRQLLLPIVGGALVAHFAPDFTKRIQPWVAKIGNIALYVVIGATLLGYLPQMGPIVRSGALLLGLAFVLAAFGIGYLAGWGSDVLEDIGGLATAQRNTAAAMLIAVSSFSDPTVFVLITLVNTIGIAVLLGVARFLKRDNARPAAA